MAECRVRVWRVEPHSESLFLLVLVDENQQLLPMTIGLCEAMSIESVVRTNTTVPRFGFAHDLLGAIITRLGGRLVKVVIDDLWNKVYFAKLHLAVDGEIVTVDARPSDAVAIAVRLEAPLFVTDSVMAAANEPDSPSDAGDAESGPDDETDDL
ncbi:MAG: bifunctional nuclease family protein [Armatimonadota bacterium]